MMKNSKVLAKNKILPSIISIILIIATVFLVLSLASCKKKKPDVNVDTNNDGKPDINIDVNDDGEPDINIDNDGDNVPDDNVDTNGDLIPDLGSDGIELPIIPIS